MKTLIVLASFLVLANAEATFEGCKAEAKAFKQCIHQEINKTKHEAFDKLKEALTKACFNDQNPKCHWPEFPPHPAGGFPKGAGHTFPTPSPSAVQCFGGAKGAVKACVKKALSIPDNVDIGSDHQGPPRRPFFHPHPNASAALAEIHQIALKACDGDEDAAKKLEECGKNFFTTQFKTQKPQHPIAAACKAAAACATAQPISDGCKELFKKGRDAFCSCRKEFPNFLQSDKSCEEFRNHKQQPHEVAHNATHEHVAGAAAHVHDLPHDHAVPFDFCDSNAASPADVCKKVLAGDH